MGLAKALGYAGSYAGHVARGGGYLAAGAGILAAPGIAGMVMAGQESAELNQAVPIGMATAAGAAGGASIGATLGAGAGALAARRSSKVPKNRPYGKAMKIGGLAGAAVGGILSTALVGRGLSNIVHAPRRLNSVQNAIPQYAEGGIQGMDL